jgi:malate dehydrogenase (oxaloacetate-decarboxylating)(NADP+)
LLCEAGVPREHITLVDVAGVIHAERENLHPTHAPFAQKTSARTLADAVNGADVFFGLSAPGILTAEMVKTMAAKPVIFAMANPTPEIMPDVARAARPDAIIGTGRSDFPNQINNVLGFPYLFRGALDCGATTFNTAMKLAAAHALANLARVEPEVGLMQAYKGMTLKFGPEYLIPKPFDNRLLSTIAPAVAKAAMESGVATRPIADLDAYAAGLHASIDQSFAIMRDMLVLAKQDTKRVVYPEGEDPRILQAAQAVVTQGIAHPIVLGRTEVVKAHIADLGLTMRDGTDYTLIDPQTDTRIEDYANDYYALRQRDGVTHGEALIHLRSRWMIWASLMVQRGEADAVVCGISGRFMRYLPIAAHIVNGSKDTSHIYALQMVMAKDRVVFMVDTHVQANPTPEQIAEMTVLAANEMKQFGIEPRVALLSHSNFGSSLTPNTEKLRQARHILQQRWPTLPVEGEMQADTALNMDVMQRIFPASALKEPANLLVFPDVDSANIGFNLVRMMGQDVEYIGPILLGMEKPVHIVSVDAPVRRVINLTTLAVVQSQAAASRRKPKLRGGR